MATVPHPAIARRQVRVTGIVQGVGFRPFVYGLATRLGLCGYVLNSSSGVEIEVEGPDAALDDFLHALETDAPPLARVADVSTTELEPLFQDGFAIRESARCEEEFALVSPDVATCSDCLSDLSDPTNRRYAYPFNNCTNCGPRYTIVQDIPYDRPATTMAAFRMCAACQREYHDPLNRRFHAQPNACPECGPSLWLVSSGETQSSADSLPMLRTLRALLRDGNIVALRGLGGFHLTCDALNRAAVERLRARKRRSDKPFAIMAREVETVERFCVVSPADREALLSSRRPIVILPRRPHCELPRELAPGNNTVGVMLPYTPLHHLLFGDSLDKPAEFAALVMTSGHISEEPIVTANDEAQERLANVADSFLLHDRDIYMRVDDSVVRTFANSERVLRRSRGYVPEPIDLGMPITELLACGAELKNTFCLTKDRYVIVSQHIGDLENYETLRFFEATLANLKKLFRVEPRAIAYDLHPRYLSTRFALAQPDLRKVAVQHHHAHIAACMAENGLRDKVIGVAFDGTGFGTDGQIWGGEFLVADLSGFERRAHLRYIPLPGGDAAVRQPWRSALSYARDAFGQQLPDVPLWQAVPQKELALVSSMLDRNFNTVQTSSCGRLFDAVAGLIGLRSEVTFEGQAAIELENIAANDLREAYPFEISASDCAEIDMRPAIRAIVSDVQRGRCASAIAAAFHNTLAAAIVEICRRVRSSDGLHRVCLSGGVFQNFYLLERAVTGLRSAGFEVCLHSKVPPNDGGISLGQAVIANQLLSEGD
jgi:hydrogenase maturation protein HypF